MSQTKLETLKETRDQLLREISKNPRTYPLTWRKLLRLDEEIAEAEMENDLYNLQQKINDEIMRIMEKQKRTAILRQKNLEIPKETNPEGRWEFLHKQLGFPEDEEAMYEAMKSARE